MPEETNRIWVYHITGRRLSGAVKWPNSFSVTDKHSAGCKTQNRSKQKKILWTSGDPILKSKYTAWIAHCHPSGNAPIWPIVSTFPERISTRGSLRNETDWRRKGWRGNRLSSGCTAEGQWNRNTFLSVSSMQFWTGPSESLIGHEVEGNTLWKWSTHYVFFRINEWKQIRDGEKREGKRWEQSGGNEKHRHNGFAARSDRHVLSRAWIQIRTRNLLGILKAVSV